MKQEQCLLWLLVCASLSRTEPVKTSKDTVNSTAVSNCTMLYSTMHLIDFCRTFWHSESLDITFLAFWTALFRLLSFSCFVESENVSMLCLQSISGQSSTSKLQNCGEAKLRGLCTLSTSLDGVKLNSCFRLFAERVNTNTWTFLTYSSMKYAYIVPVSGWKGGLGGNRWQFLEKLLKNVKKKVFFNESANYNYPL